jgi:endonuclease YncB( thermonuclease family)
MNYNHQEKITKIKTNKIFNLHVLGVTLFLSCFTVPAFAESIIGKVVSVHDGDTITVLDKNYNQIKVRLAEIDAPELSQPFGKKSKLMLSNIVFGKFIELNSTEKDNYGRVIGTIILEDMNVNLEMVSLGGAWAYIKYMKNDDFLEVEKKAKNNSLGLWALPSHQRMPPWDWRKVGSATKPKTPTLSNSLNFSCGTKRYCKQMINCSEARFYLTNCGLSRLDGDSDGIPCEKLC